jgi:hypothetical protein
VQVTETGAGTWGNGEWKPYPIGNNWWNPPRPPVRLQGLNSAELHPESTAAVCARVFKWNIAPFWVANGSHLIKIDSRLFGPTFLGQALSFQKSGFCFLFQREGRRVIGRSRACLGMGPGSRDARRV